MNPDSSTNVIADLLRRLPAVEPPRDFPRCIMAAPPRHRGLQGRLAHAAVGGSPNGAPAVFGCLPILPSCCWQATDGVRSAFLGEWSPVADLPQPPCWGSPTEFTRARASSPLRHPDRRRFSDFHHPFVSAQSRHGVLTRFSSWSPSLSSLFWIPRTASTPSKKPFPWAKTRTPWPALPVASPRRSIGRSRRRSRVGLWSA